MNFIKHFNEIFQIFDNDPRIGVYHISLYMALFRQWNRNEFKNPILVNREMTMKKAKINSPQTYTKLMNELARWGYLKYEKSTSRIYGSKVDLFPTSPSNGQVVPSYKNLINNRNIYKGKKYESFSEDQIFNTKNLSNSDQNKANHGFTPPPLEHVKIYFDEKGAPEIEAEKFFNYYEARDWLNKSFNPITNWKASARNWILNIPKFNPKRKSSNRHQRSPNITEKDKSRTNNHQLNQNKDYGAPL